MNRRFASVARWGMRASLLLVVGAFALYVGGVLPGWVPLAWLPTHIGQGADAFVAAGGMPTGWRGAGGLGHGDVLSLGALISLMGVVAVAYLALLPLLLRHRERLYLALVLLQLVVLVLAAGGWLGGSAR
jgi:hypothetical protein